MEPKSAMGVEPKRPSEKVVREAQVPPQSTIGAMLAGGGGGTAGAF